MSGWIKVHRKLLDSPVFQNEKLLKVFLWCLLKAHHKEHTQLIGRQQVLIQPGQFPTGRHKAASELDMAPSTAWEYLKLLESNNTINITSNNKYSVITIVNWEVYQSEGKKTDSKADTKPNSKPTANQQQIDTNKNVKNDKNVKKGSGTPKLQFAERVWLTEAQHLKLLETHGEDDTAKLIDILNNYKLANGKNYKSDYHAILNWVVKRLEEDKRKAGKSRNNYSQPISIYDDLDLYRLPTQQGGERVAK